jgi:hypothetical protein
MAKRCTENVVYDVVKSHLDVDVLGGIKHFAGAVLFIRRRRDEMISTRPVCSCCLDHGVPRGTSTTAA